jgi:hypothetical protein
LRRLVVWWQRIPLKSARRSRTAASVTVCRLVKITQLRSIASTSVRLPALASLSDVMALALALDVAFFATLYREELADTT